MTELDGTGISFKIVVQSPQKRLSIVIKIVYAKPLFLSLSIYFIFPRKIFLEKTVIFFERNIPVEKYYHRIPIGLNPAAVFIQIESSLFWIDHKIFLFRQAKNNQLWFVKPPRKKSQRRG